MKNLNFITLLTAVFALNACQIEPTIEPNDGDNNFLINDNTQTDNQDSQDQSVNTPDDELVVDNEPEATTPVEDSTPVEDNNDSQEVDNDPVTDNQYEQDLIAGEELYDQYCVGCHLEDGSGPTGANLIDCISCNDHGLLSFRIDDTMPPTDTSLLNLVQSAQVADYIMANFAISVDANESTNLSFISTLTPSEAAYKVAFDVAGKTPSVSEVNAFETSSDAVLDQWLNSEFFYQRLMSFYNKKLKTDSFHSRFERESNYTNARSIINACERGMGNTCNSDSADRVPYFENHMWWDELPYEGVIADLTNDAIAREPLEFIRYVAKNDLPFSEILTSEFALVNAYTAKSLDAKNLDGTAITSEDFDKIDAPMVNKLVDGQSVSTKYLVPFKEQLRDMNRLRGTDVQINIGNDSNLEDFLTLYPEDPSHFIPAKLEQSSLTLPLAGILSTKAFLNNFTTTPTNKQRTRANMVFNIFAATDILAIEANRDASVIDFSDSLGAVDPTKTNEDCLVCHRKLDPVADAFKNWIYNGVYINSACQDSGNINSCATTPSVGIGFEGVQAPIFGTNSVDSNALQWLAKTIAEDPLFAKSVAQTLFTGFTGKEILLTDPSKGATYQAQYEAQQALLANMINTFNESNENIKETAKVLLTSDYYLAKRIVNNEDLDKIGSDRILGADQLQNKFYATTKHISSTTEVDDSFKLNLGNRSTWKMYGGVDGLNTHALPNEQGGIMLTIQERLANEMACFVTAQDLYRNSEDRLFLQDVDYQMIAGNGTVNEYVLNELDAKKAIAHMHLHFWHQEVSINSKEVDEVYNLLNDVITMGRALREEGEADRNLAGYCRVDYDPDTNVLLDGADRAYRDGEYTVRAWSVVLAYFLGDFKFSHI